MELQEEEILKPNLLDELSGCIFHPRIVPPPNYSVINCPETQKILFTHCVIRSPLRTRNTLIFFHGNGEVIEDYIAGEFVSSVLARMNICLVEYRGYGSLSQVKPEVVKMLNDTELLKKNLERQGIYVKSSIVMGRSIGSIFATEFIKRFPETAGIIIESGFYNPTEFYWVRIAHKMKNGDIELDPAPKEEEFKELSRAHLFNGEKLAPYQGPVLIIHAEDDHIVPATEGKSLYEHSTSEKKEILLFELGRHNVTTWNKEAYWSKFYEFVDKIFEFIPIAPEMEVTQKDNKCNIQ